MKTAASWALFAIGMLVVLPFAFALLVRWLGFVFDVAGRL